MMKKSIFLILLMVITGVSAKAQSTDQTTIPITKEQYRFEATIICLDAIEAPTKYNEFAKQFTNQTSFPKEKEADSSDELKTQIDTWLKDHPLVVNQILTERKKAHDILYGPRPY